MTRPTTGARFRTRKLSTKQQLAVVRESQIDNIDDTDAQRNIPTIETGVERQEEIEHHLQAAINASQAAVVSGKAAQIIIPTPNAGKIATDELDALYPKKFPTPASYIRYSSTVEDVTGCPYSLGEEDLEFLTKYNLGRRVKCSEVTFEAAMWHFETVVQAKQPFLVLDHSQIMPYEEFEAAFDDETLEETKDPQIRVHAKSIYPYWKEQRIKNEGRPLMPTLKFEQGTDKDDGDPYVCFRRREVRQVRKTRRTDTQSSEKLLRLRGDMADAKALLESVVKREHARKQGLEMDYHIFEARQKLKETKRLLNIRGDDEDLVNLKQKKRPIEVPTPTQRAPLHRLDQRAPENDLVRYEDVLQQRKKKLRSHIEDKLAVRARLDSGFEDFTEKPYERQPSEDDPQSYFRPARIVHLPSPSPTLSPASSPEDTTPFSLEPIEEEPSSPPPRMLYRGRFGRGGRFIVDRRFAKRASPPPEVDDIIKDRFKFDHTDDEENPVYELNPYSEELLRFRARLLSGPLGGDHSQHHSHQIHQQVALAARRQQQHAQQIAEMGGIPPINVTTH